MTPRQGNALRESALEAIPKKDQKELRIRRFLAVRQTAGEPELTLLVGAQGRNPTTVTAVTGLLERLADVASVSRLERQCRAGCKSWKAKDLAKLTGCSAANSLRSLDLSYNNLDAPALEALGKGGLVGLRSLEMRGVPFDSAGLQALSRGSWPNLSQLELGGVTAGAGQLIALLESLPGLRSLRIGEWRLADQTIDESGHSLQTLVHSAAFRGLEGFGMFTDWMGQAAGLVAALGSVRGCRLRDLDNLPATGPELPEFLGSELANQLQRLGKLTIVPESLRGPGADQQFPVLESLGVTVVGADVGLQELAHALGPNLVDLSIESDDEVARALIGGAAMLRRLELRQGTRGSLGQGAIDALATNSVASKLTRLRVEAGLGQGILATLAGAPLASLTGIDLTCRDSTLADPAVAELMTAPWVPHLHELRLPRAGLGDDSARAIATTTLSELGLLDLRGNALEKAGIDALSRSESLTQLHTLELRGNLNSVSQGMDNSSLKALTDGKRLPHLQSLTVPPCTSTPRQAKALAEQPRVHVSVESF